MISTFAYLLLSLYSTASAAPGPIAYRIKVKTGCDPAAGTKSRVFITLSDAHNNSVSALLPTRGHFYKCQQDNFTVLNSLPSDTVMGPICQVKIGHDHSALHHSWFLESVQVYDKLIGQNTLFQANRWLDGQHLMIISMDRCDSSGQMKVTGLDDSAFPDSGKLPRAFDFTTTSNLSLGPRSLAYNDTTNQTTEKTSSPHTLASAKSLLATPTQADKQMNYTAIIDSSTTLKSSDSQQTIPSSNSTANQTAPTKQKKKPNFLAWALIATRRFLATPKEIEKQMNSTPILVPGSDSNTSLVDHQVKIESVGIKIPPPPI